MPTLLRKLNPALRGAQKSHVLGVQAGFCAPGTLTLARDRGAKISKDKMGT